MKNAVKEYAWCYLMILVISVMVGFLVTAASHSTFFHHTSSDTTEERLDAYCHSIGKGDVDVNLAKGGDAIGTWYCTE